MLSSSYKYCYTFLCFSLFAANAQQWPQDYFEARVYSHENYEFDLPYRLFIPDNYNANNSYPLVTHLSGIGARGTDNLMQLTSSAGATVWAARINQAVNPCFVLAPQCPISDTWYNFASDNMTVSSQMTMDVIDSLLQEFSIDTNRLYLNGLSLGGYGTFDVITKNPDRFAAAVPICGGGDTTQADKIKHIPIWIFHSDDDNTVPVENSRSMFRSLLRAGSTSALYTEYTGYGHWSWVPAYAEPDLQKWVFAQKKNYTASAPLAVANLSGEGVGIWQINLTWQVPENTSYPESGAWYYAIYRDGLKIGITGSLFYYDEGLADATTYTYEVRAVNWYLKESQDNIPVQITTLTDLEAPVVISSAVVDQAHDSALVRIKFNEPMAESSVITLENYQISPEADIYNACLSEDMKSVLLSVAPLHQDQDYTITLNNLKDRALAQNVIAANTETTCRRGEWLYCPIGPTEVTGSLMLEDNVFTVTSNGHDIAGTSDACTFIHKNGEGNLSISVRIDTFSAKAKDAKAGIMIRESIEANSPSVSLVILKSGLLQMMRRYKKGNNTIAWNIMEYAVTLPIYVKMERIGGKFYLYQSDDGLDWGESLRITSIKMTDKAKMGLCLSAYSDSMVSAVFDHVEIAVEPLTIDVIHRETSPVAFQLGAAYPNPFNPSTTISYQLPTTSEVELSIYNLLGQKVATLVSKKQPAGKHQVQWDASGFASGIYYYMIKAGDFRQVKKMVLMR